MKTAKQGRGKTKMATVTDAATASDAASENPQTTRIGVDALPCGKALRSPIYDDAGVLLLAEGVIITPAFKEKLMARDVSGVMVSLADAADMRLCDLKQEIGGSVAFDDGHVERLNAMIDSGSLFVSNSGVAARENIVLHGCKGYDKEARQELLHMHEEASKELDNMMKQALRGDEIDSTALASQVGAYASALSADPDSVMAVAAQLSQDPSLAEHSLKTAVLALALGLEMGLDEENLRVLGLCGLVQDWGMVKVPEEIRHSRYALSSIEDMQIKKHPGYTLDMLEKIQGVPNVVALVAYQVHERPNGRGYPQGRHKHHIHLFARILAVADSYSALTSSRPNRAPLMPYSAMECLIRQARTGDVDPDVVRALLQVLSLFPIGSFVVLSDGSLARVLRRSTSNYASPIVRLIADKDGERFDQESDSSIIDLNEDDRKIIQALPDPGSDEMSFQPELIDARR